MSTAGDFTSSSDLSSSSAPTSVPASAPAYSTTFAPDMSSSSTIQGCSAATAVGTSGSACADPYGNTFTVSSGSRYVGSVRAVIKAPSLSSCLTQCDETPDCRAANYNSTSGACYLLDNVTGVEQVTGPGADGAQAASRPADATSVASTPPPMYTTPPQDQYPTTTTTAGPNGSSVAQEEACSTAEPAGEDCMDSYGNTFTISSGTKYSGVSRPVTHADSLDDCLTQCDALGADCEAANYDASTGDCELLEDVDGIVIVSGPDAADAIAASRDGDNAVYTVPPSTTAGGPTLGEYGPSASTTTDSMTSTTGQSGINTGVGPVPSQSLPGVGPAATSSSTSSAAPSSTGSGIVSRNGLCGAQNDGTTCVGSGFGDCCSEYGYCGSTDGFCGTGCQTPYGSCFTLTGASSTPEPGETIFSSQGAETPGGYDGPTTTTTAINSVSVMPIPGYSPTTTPGSQGADSTSVPVGYGGGSSPSQTISMATSGSLVPPTGDLSTSVAMAGGTSTRTIPGGYGAGSVSGSGVTPGSMTGSMSYVAGSLSSTMGPMSMSMSMSGSMSASGIPGGDGSATPSASLSMSPSASSPPFCPAYDDINYTDASGTTYAVQCSTSYSGSIRRRLSNPNPATGQPYTAESCLETCSQDDMCMAITLTADACTLYRSVSGVSNETGSTAALKQTSAAENVVTVTASVCSSKRVGTVTILTTATMTTCAADSCPTEASMNGRLI
ncbi:hypothetical protein B0A50_04421 [Salinomyces thailandicus]|uniref:Uncharacterized protein n=1 Tax=Salinomyces thailandicus TaxID=706561 RepID=A0A4V5N4F8_9PEZI|nr:hypothetical protein B0A50_04421 [Salinomyces thailandica]